MTGLFSFGQPCLKWKIIVAQSNQYGFPGFNPPYVSRYLTLLSRVTIDGTNLTTVGGDPVEGVTSREGTYTIAPQSGEMTSVSGDGTIVSFPYGLPLNVDPTTQTTEVSSDGTYFKTTFYRTYAGFYGYEAIISEGWLSDKYEVSAAAAVCDQLIQAVDVAALPWNSCSIASFGGGVSEPIGLYTSGGNLIGLLPANVNYSSNGDYPPFGNTGFLLTPTLQAAAWSIFAPGNVSTGLYYPNGIMKAIGYVCMAGNYCEKTFTLGLDGTDGGSTCQSGVGSCQGMFTVTPPPVVENGPNHYVLIQPNCACGS